MVKIQLQTLILHSTTTQKVSSTHYSKYLTYELDFLKALALTLSIELAVGLLLRRFDHRFGFKLKTIPIAKFIIGILLASIMTLPYVWFVFPIFLKTYLPFLIVAELFAFLLEALFYQFFFGFNWKFALFFSFSLNFISFFIGLFIF